VNKYDLLMAVSWTYGLNIKITPTAATTKCDRSLGSVFVSDFSIPTIEVQIEEQKDFYPILSENIS